LIESDHALVSFCFPHFPSRQDVQVWIASGNPQPRPAGVAHLHMPPDLKML
jgi:hypothetical protein